jgi:hypothetical protein
MLRGAKPGDIPVEQATKFDLAVNLDCQRARSLGASLPLRQSRLDDGDPVRQLDCKAASHFRPYTDIQWGRLMLSGHSDYCGECPLLGGEADIVSTPRNVRF